jgi:hypothetical protein
MKVVNHFVDQNDLMFLELGEDLIEHDQVLDMMEVAGELVEFLLMVVQQLVEILVVEEQQFVENLLLVVVKFELVAKEIVV